MSSLIDLEEMEADLQEILEADDTPAEAFYLALKNALVQLERHPISTYS
jgi:hypothetical protein